MAILLYVRPDTYSWVERGKLPAFKNPNPSDLAVVRRAKAWAGWTGASCKVKKSSWTGASFSDMITVRPYGMNKVMFIMWVEDDIK